MTTSPPLTKCNFFYYLLFFNVNLGFAHVYTPPLQTFVYTPNLKFLEITQHDLQLQIRVSEKGRKRLSQRLTA